MQAYAYRSRPASSRPSLESMYPFIDFTNVMGYSPPPSSPEHEDPGLMATFGPLLVLNSTPPKKHIIGRAPDCDFVVTGEYAHLTSRHHCELIWDGLQTSIVDLQSMNGTWVNSRRLADGEVLLLRDKDIVSFSALPFDRRPNRDRTGRMFYGCTLGKINAIQFMYLEYTLETLTDKLSSTGYAIRQSMDELLRIRTVIRSVPRPTENKLSYPAPRLSDASTPLYRGPLNRPDRPETPVYAPPLPLDDTPDLLDDLPNSRNWPGPEDPDGLPADHPDLIWSKDVRYNCTPSSHLPPLEMRQWSHCFGLPIGLHTYWPIISSTAYGTRDRDVSPDALRDLAYYIRRIRPDWPVLDVSTPEYTARNPHAFMVDWQPVCASEDPCAEHGLALSEGSRVPETTGSITPVISPASPSLPPLESATRNADASVLAHSMPGRSGPRKRPRTDEQDDKRPLKRIALAPEFCSAGLSALAPPLPSSKEKYATLDPDSPGANTPPSGHEHLLRDAVPTCDTVHASRPSTASANSIVKADVPAHEEGKPTKRRHEVEADAEVDALRFSKRRRAADPPQPVRRLLRVREKA